jgi:hypothetical protein
MYLNLNVLLSNFDLFKPLKNTSYILSIYEGVLKTI